MEGYRSRQIVRKVTDEGTWVLEIIKKREVSGSKEKKGKNR